MKVPFFVALEGAQLCSEELDQEKTMDETSVSSYLLPGGGATEAAAGASERSLHCHDFSAHTVSDPEHEGPQCPVSIPGVVICVFSHKVNHLACVVFNIVSIISFKTCYH